MFSFRIRHNSTFVPLVYTLTRVVFTVAGAEGDEQRIVTPLKIAGAANDGDDGGGDNDGDETEAAAAAAAADSEQGQKSPTSKAIGNLFRAVDSQSSGPRRQTNLSKRPKVQNRRPRREGDGGFEVRDSVFSRHRVLVAV